MNTMSASIDGIPMRWEEHGEGPPVVLIHGIPTCPALWRHVVPAIRGARCLAWEMPGYGASIPAGEDKDISIAAQADHLVAWMRHIGLTEAVLVGHDLGGGVAQIAAVRHPALVRGLLLTNAIAYDSWPIPSVKAVAATGGAVKHMPDAAFKQFLSAFYARGHETGEAADEALATHWPHYEAHGGAAAFVRQVQALDVQDTKAIADRLSGLGVPARIVWGAADQFQKVEYGERLAGDLNAPLRRIEGGKHFTPEDHPAILAEEINLLLEEIARREGATGDGPPAG